MKKALFIRLDKIGDLIATLPVDQAKELSSWKIKWVISDGLGVLARSSIPEREYFELSKGDSIKSFFQFSKKDSKNGFYQILQILKSEKPDVVCIFQAPWWVSLACWIARVPIRGGRLSQWHSFLFMNKGLRQSRSEAKKHEADYNFEIVQNVFNFHSETTPYLKLSTTSSSTSFNSLSFTNDLVHLSLQNKKYFVIHPGMFGSALNWPQKKYNDLISLLLQQHPNSTIVITGTKNDERFLTEIRAVWDGHESDGSQTSDDIAQQSLTHTNNKPLNHSRKNIQFLVDRLSMNQLLVVLKNAQAVIAPSTGVLHLAASMGTRTIGIYSPIQVHHPRRWGPRSKNSVYLLPENGGGQNCPAKMKCLENTCSFYPCMDTISPQTVIEKINDSK